MINRINYAAGFAHFSISPGERERENKYIVAAEMRGEEQPNRFWVEGYRRKEPNGGGER